MSNLKNELVIIVLNIEKYYLQHLLKEFSKIGTKDIFHDIVDSKQIVNDMIYWILLLILVTFFLILFLLITFLSNVHGNAWSS